MGTKLLIFLAIQAIIHAALNITNAFFQFNIESKLLTTNIQLINGCDLFPYISPIYYCIVHVSIYNITRLNTGYSSWARYIKYTNPKSILKIFSTRRYKKYESITRVYDNQGTVPYFGYIYAFEVALRDFLFHTDLPWFIRTTDDVFFYFPNLAKLMNLLEKKYDPYKDKVIKGHFCGNNFLHGGSGWLLSRKTAEIFYRLLTKEPIKKSIYGDDVCINKYLKQLDIPVKQWNSRAFLGSPFSPSTLDHFINLNFSNLPECKNNVMIRLKDIAIWHAGTKTLYPLIYGNEYMKKMPFNLYGSANSKGQLELCQNANFSDPAFSEDL